MRYSKDEIITVAGKLPAGGTVTIKLMDMGNNTLIELTDDACTESVIGGVYIWDTSNIKEPVTVYTNVLYEMSDGTNKFIGKFVLTGYVDEIDDKVWTREDRTVTDLNADAESSGMTQAEHDALMALSNYDDSNVITKLDDIRELVDDLDIDKATAINDKLDAIESDLTITKDRTNIIINTVDDVSDVVNTLTPVDDNKVTEIAEAVWSSTNDVFTDLLAKVTDIKDYQAGNWYITDNQMVFEREDGSVMAKYNLYNRAGNPTETSAYKRIKV